MGRIAGDRAKLDFSYCTSSVNEVLNRFLNTVKAQELQGNKYEYVKVEIIPKLQNDKYKQLF